jgi:prophage maintenance system killer protein
MKNEIILFENENVKLEVNMQDETVWLTQAQMAELFENDRKTITRHIQNIYKEGELEDKSVCSFFEHTANDGKNYKTQFYNLDMIISIGYRVNSKKGTQFRIWANKILKEYLLKGYVENKRRLEYLEKTIKLIDIATRIDDEVGKEQGIELLKVIKDYTYSLDLLDNYDYKEVKKPSGTIIKDKILKYEDCINVINNMKFKEKSNLFGMERDNGLQSIINNVYQSFGEQDVYKSVEEKGANLLYLIIKNHVFTDGNKRIGATIFLYFLDFYGLLYKNGNKTFAPETLVATTLLIAESNPKEKDVIIDLVMNFIVEGINSVE